MGSLSRLRLPIIQRRRHPQSSKGDPGTYIRGCLTGRLASLAILGPGPGGPHLRDHNREMRPSAVTHAGSMAGILFPPSHILKIFLPDFVDINDKVELRKVIFSIFAKLCRSLSLLLILLCSLILVCLSYCYSGRGLNETEESRFSYWGGNWLWSS